MNEQYKTVEDIDKALETKTALLVQKKAELESLKNKRKEANIEDSNQKEMLKAEFLKIVQNYMRTTEKYKEILKQIESLEREELEATNEKTAEAPENLNVESDVKEVNLTPEDIAQMPEATQNFIELLGKENVERGIHYVSKKEEIENNRQKELKRLRKDDSVESINKNKDDCKRANAGLDEWIKLRAQYPSNNDFAEALLTSPLRGDIKEFLNNELYGQDLWDGKYEKFREIYIPWEDEINRKYDLQLAELEKGNSDEIQKNNTLEERETVINEVVGAEQEQKPEPELELSIKTEDLENEKSADKIAGENTKESELAEIDAQEKEALAVKEYIPKNVVGYLTIPHNDGSFSELAFTKDPQETASFYQVEDLGNNKFALIFWNSDQAIKDATNSPERIIRIISNEKGIGGDKVRWASKKITTTKPAIYKKENGRFILEEKADTYYTDPKLPDKEISIIKEKFNALRKKVEEKYDREEKIVSKTTASNENTKINLAEKLPSKIEFYLSTPNSDGSFNKSSARTEYIEGASLYAFQRLHDNKYEVYINPNPKSYKLMMSYPDKNIDPVFGTISAFNPNANDLQTIEPAIVELENEKFKLISKGQMDFDKVGIERENNRNTQMIE
jgi:hypothetical protein